MKKLILMNIDAKSRNSLLPACWIFKNRFITERDFDPDEDFNTKSQLSNWKCVFSYAADDIEINIIRNKANNTYELKIEGGKRAKATEYLKTAEDIITIGKETDALYSCYIKVRETALNIIRDIEGCEIYGYMRKPHDYNDFKFCDNDSLITTYDLHKIA